MRIRNSDYEIKTKIRKELLAQLVRASSQYSKGVGSTLVMARTKINQWMHK